MARPTRKEGLIAHLWQILAILMETSMELTQGAICGLEARRRRTLSRSARMRVIKDTEHEQALALTAAVVESATGGVIVTNRAGRIMTYNQRFVRLWRLDDGWERSGYPGLVVDQVRDRAIFLRRIADLLEATDQEGYDLIPLCDERVLERYSTPYRVGERVAGRLWSYRDVTERVRIEQALRRRDMILEAISRAVERFLKSPDLENHLQDLLARLGQASNVSRVYIFENSLSADGALLMSQRYEWCAPGIVPQIDNQKLQSLPYQAGGFTRWETTLRSDGSISGQVAAFPAAERAILEPQDIHSIAVVPIFVGPHWWGFMGFDDCERSRDWSTIELDTLKIAASLLGATMQRQRFEDEIRTLNANLERRVRERTHQLSQVNQQLEQSMEQLRDMALHDGLTGLPNRRLLNERLQHAIDLSKRHAPGHFAVLLIDVDDFKQINDGLGHLAGDQLLIEIAHRLSSCTRTSDTVARLGGDEFTVLLEERVDLAAVISIVERMQQALAQPFTLEGNEVLTSASIGVVLNGPWHAQAADLLRDADVALYRAKAHRNGQYAVFVHEHFP